MSAPSPQQPFRNDTRRTGSRQDHILAFFKGFLDEPKQVGSIIPSSRFLEKRLVKVAELARADVAIELGPGTGGTTRAMLARMKPEARLLAIEINPKFGKLLQRTIRDPRLIVHTGSAADIGEALRAHDLPPADVILSGIPFSTMGRELGLSILCSIDANLAPSGRFVAYQFRDRVESLGRQVMGAPSVQVEMLNVPPMRIYRWDKSLSPRPA
jgi:phospholipid N-methyltransferase